MTRPHQDGPLFVTLRFPSRQALRKVRRTMLHELEGLEAVAAAMGPRTPALRLPYDDQRDQEIAQVREVIVWLEALIGDARTS